MGIPSAWTGLVDDAAVFPPGNAPLHAAAADHVARRQEWWSDLVGPLVVRDTDIPLLRGSPARLAVVVTGGAGQIAGPAGLCNRLGLELAALEIALRDLDDLAGNARRVLSAVGAAVDTGDLAEDVPVYVELPAERTPEPGTGWLGAADEVAAAGARLKFRTGGLEADLFPAAGTLTSWIDAALDRETPFKCTAGLHNAVRHRDRATGFEHHGFLNVLVATGLLFDGGPGAVEALEETDGPALVNQSKDLELDRMRRWFTSFGSCSVTDPRDDLIALGLLEEPV